MEGLRRVCVLKGRFWHDGGSNIPPVKTQSGDHLYRHGFGCSAVQDQSLHVSLSKSRSEIEQVGVMRCMPDWGHGTMKPNSDSDPTASCVVECVLSGPFPGAAMGLFQPETPQKQTMFDFVWLRMRDGSPAVSRSGAESRLQSASNMPDAVRCRR